MNEIIDNDAFDFIAQLINPTEDTPSNFIFQIISNSLNGLDVDKLDYLCRDCYYFGTGIPFDLTRIISHAQVIDLNICFPEKVSYDIYKVYRSRYDLHKQYYNHKTVVTIEYMMRRVLENLDSILNISLSIKNNQLDKFIDLVDSTILNTSSIIKLCDNTIYEKYKNKIDEIDIILNKIYQRKLYKCLYSKSFCVSEIIDINDKITEVLLNDKELLNKKLNKDNIDTLKVKPVKIKIGLLGGNKKHPFDSLYFYDKYNKSDILTKDKISHLMSPFFQEIILYILYLD
jgi:HD superfamily phosphohydrolase